MKVTGHHGLSRVVPASIVPRERDAAPPIICVNVVVQSSPPPPLPAAVTPEPKPIPREVHVPPLEAAPHESVTPPPLAAAAYATHASLAEPVQPRAGVMIQVRA